MVIFNEDLAEIRFNPHKEHKARSERGGGTKEGEKPLGLGINFEKSSSPVEASTSHIGYSNDSRGRWEKFGEMSPAALLSPEPIRFWEKSMAVVSTNRTEGRQGPRKKHCVFTIEFPTISRCSLLARGHE